MAGKRKRKHTSTTIKSHEKRQKISNLAKGNSIPKDSVIRQALLAQFYPEVVTLREYLLARLPSTSKIRKRKVLSVGTNKSSDLATDQELGAFLDRTLVGVLESKYGRKEDRWRHWGAFSQKLDDSTSKFIDLNAVGRYSQSEIVDFAIWLLFSKCKAVNGRAQHLLCQGYQKEANSRMGNREGKPTSAITGVVSTYPNSHVDSFKRAPWPQILLLMGREGEKMMVDLILDCGMFVQIGMGRGIYHQLSGTPLSDLQVLSEKGGKGWIALANAGTPDSGGNSMGHSVSTINFVRSRMVYARAALNAQGGVRFGLRHIHVLNRHLLSRPGAKPNHSSRDDNNVIGCNTKEASPDPSTIQIMMYLFPRQFGLHNVFTSEVDHRQTVQPYKDYTLREDEINQRYPPEKPRKIPKRLRGRTTDLVRKLQVQHERCAYKKLLEYYCPVINTTPKFPLPPIQQQSAERSSGFKTQVTRDTPTPITSVSNGKYASKEPTSMMNHATPSSMVSAFCCSVLSTLIPKEFWGTGSIQAHNEKIFLYNVNRFIELRRFESLSLHEVSQGLRISSIEWLQQPGCANNKSSQSDTKKRLEIFHEFLYYVFDSCLIPLIRANFHVTESNVHRYRLFYYRHDVWKSLVEPAIATLKLTMFEEVKLEKARQLLGSRKLGFSQVRLLPKETGVRPIMNLKRRAVKPGSKTLLGSSINAILAPVYNAFTYEMSQNPTRLGATLFSVGDLYTRLKPFQIQLANTTKPLYFIKLDVKSAFDTIPQSSILKLMTSLTSQQTYRISKHVEIKPGENYRVDPRAKPMRIWTALAKSLDDTNPFDHNLTADKKNTVIIQNTTPQFRTRTELLALLTSHISQNLVKIGKKYYRQKSGIPQGSILSSLLCNYFYADFETHHLSFLDPKSSLLLRLIDDFLLITTNPNHAKRFLQIMHDGIPSYGIQVNAKKTLVNFEVDINGAKICRVVEMRKFPYCGCLIDMKNLDISRDRERRKDLALVDSLTVEYSRNPGRNFHRKVLNSFKIQTHSMFLDTTFNTLPTVQKNIYTAFIECAEKMWMYNRCLPIGKQPGCGLLKKVIGDVIQIGYLLMKNKRNGKGGGGYYCGVSKVMVEWLGVNAFWKVLWRRQSKYLKVLEWLEERILGLRVRERGVCERMMGVVGCN